MKKTIKTFVCAGLASCLVLGTMTASFAGPAAEAAVSQTQQADTSAAADVAGDSAAAADTAADSAAGAAALWMWTENADGTRVMDEALMHQDFNDFFNFMASFDGKEFPYHSTQETVAAWAQVSERGAAWKALFDQYGIPYDLCGENPYQARGAAFTTAPGKSADEQYSVAGAVQMMIWILTDGMSQAERSEERRVGKECRG